MKQLFIPILMIMNYGSGHAQGLSNIFNQKVADLKSMGKQIALLQLYIGWLEKGYSIARSGLTTIGEIKQGDFNLNSIFLNSLSNVHPAIQKCSKVAAILELVQAIKKQMDGMEAIEHLSGEEHEYLADVKTGFFNECAQSLDVLMDLVTANTYEMDDGERMKMIDGIYCSILNKSLLATEFNREARMVAEQRAWDNLNIQTLKNLEGL